MTKIYIDTNIFFNVWNEEVDPKMEKNSGKVLKKYLKKSKEKRL